MAVTLPITDPILASLATLGPGSDDEPGFGLYGQPDDDGPKTDGYAAANLIRIGAGVAGAGGGVAAGAVARMGAEHDGRVNLLGLTARRLFWLEFDLLAPDPVPPLPAGSPTTLRRFGQLPAEIRLQIWEESLRQQNRVITVTCRSADSMYLPGAPGHCVYAPLPPQRSPPALVPALFQVSREAYAVARRYYVRAFDWRVPYSLADPVAVPAFVLAVGQPIGSLPQDRDQVQHRLASMPPDVYRRPGGRGCLFNFEADVLVLQGDLEPHDGATATSMAYFLPLEDARRVRHMACSATDLGVGHLQHEVLFSRLFPLVDRFQVRDRLLMVTPPTTAQEQAQSRGKPIPYDKICQQVWRRWTNSQNMPQLLGAGAGEEGSIAGGSDDDDDDDGQDIDAADNDMLATLYYSPSSRDYGSKYSGKDQMRIVTVPEDQIYACVAEG